MKTFFRMLLIVVLAGVALTIAHYNPIKLSITLPLIGTFHEVPFAIFFLLSVFIGAFIMSIFNLIKESQRAIESWKKENSEKKVWGLIFNPHNPNHFSCVIDVSLNDGDHISKKEGDICA